MPVGRTTIGPQLPGTDLTASPSGALKGTLGGSSDGSAFDERLSTLMQTADCGRVATTDPKDVMTTCPIGRLAKREAGHRCRNLVNPAHDR